MQFFVDAAGYDSFVDYLVELEDHRALKELFPMPAPWTEEMDCE